MNALALEWFQVVFRPKVGALFALWGQKAFWRQSHFPLHWTSLVCGLVFWVGTIAIFLITGTAPRPGWLFVAFLSVIVSLTMTWRVYDGMKESGKRLRPAMLLLQFTMIILLNGPLLLLMWAFGVQLEWVDWQIIITANVGVLITVIVRAIRRESFTTDWALFGYATSMKSLPQVFQAWDLFTTPAMLNPWVVGSLFLQGTSRWQLSRYAYKDNPTVEARAQFWNASFDLLTVGFIQAAAILDAVR